MEETTSGSSNSAQMAATENSGTSANTPSTPEKASGEHRQAYGTAKTENLRDSGLWRIILPTFVVLCCLALLIIPLGFLFLLMSVSINPASVENQLGVNLTWLWGILIIIALAIVAVIIRGFYRIFLTQAGNYSG